MPISEKEMIDRIIHNFGTTLKTDDFDRKYAAREVHIRVQEVPGDTEGDRILDLVEYGKKKKTFKVVEFKSGHSTAIIREAFKQVAKYRAILEGRALTFLNAFTRKSPMRYGRLMEATSGGKQIHVEFYVGLKDEVCCQHVDLLRVLKKRYPETGIMRVKDDGKIKFSVKDAGSKHDYRLAQARPVVFAITWPPASKDLDNAMPTSGAVAENELCPVSR